jgi:hypothetical protein
MTLKWSNALADVATSSFLATVVLLGRVEAG